MKKDTTKEYERNHSHSHCWNQGKSPACGQPLKKHTQCCLCDTPAPKDNTIEEVMKKLDKLVEKYGHIEFYLEPELEVRTLIREALSAQKEEIGREIVEALEKQRREHESDDFNDGGDEEYRNRRIAVDSARVGSFNAALDKAKSIVSSITSNKEKK